jgi:predicted dehydrogenase
MRTDTIGVGIAGYGAIGRVHTLAYRSIPMYYGEPASSLALAGVCVTSELKGQAAVREAGFQFYTTDYSALLAHKDVDIVCISTPNDLHKSMLIEAMRAGKGVFCEKPVALNLSEAREVEAVMKDTGRDCAVGFQFRFVPAILRAKQIIEEGRLGRVFSFRLAYLRSSYVDPHIPMKWKLDADRCGGGALVDLGPHPLDLVRYLLGEVQRVFAHTKTFVCERPVAPGAQELAPVSVEDMAVLHLELGDGAVGTVEVSRVATGTTNDLRLEIHGSHGALAFSLMDPNWLYFYDGEASGHPLGGYRGFQRIETIQHYPPPAQFPAWDLPVGMLRFYVACQYEFLRSYRSGEPYNPGLRDGTKVQEIVEAAYRSAARGLWVDLPLG